MKIITHCVRFVPLTVLAFNRFACLMRVQEVIIPDPGLSTAIREALQ